MKNPTLVENFTSVFKHCRPCFQLKMIDSNENADEEGSNDEVLCVIFVLKRLISELIESKDLANLKFFGTMLRQLSRSVIKVKGNNLLFLKFLDALKVTMLYSANFPKRF